MARKNEVIFIVPYKVINQNGNIMEESLMDMPAVSIEEANNRVAYKKVRFVKGHVPQYPGCTIAFGDTKTKIGGYYIHAKKKNWQKLQETMAKMGVNISDSDAQWFQKNWSIGVRNMAEMAREIAIKYYGKEDNNNEDKN